MGLLSVLGKRGMRALESGEMFGRMPVRPSRVTEKDEMLMRLLLENPQATDADIAALLFRATDGVEDPLRLARRYRERHAYHMGPNPSTWGT